ncbi:hypothetical protein FLONG3_5222 [Fusarium longipes]|uniref:Uncharacterized protein n=1 Tax=Fusarium longipes TaxID=694270 RepID=A0A395SVP3_9HYPO|nr:hypothetical protein FLONG3_5222 [Fusarium longipes]
MLSSVSTVHYTNTCTVTECSHRGISHLPIVGWSCETSITSIGKVTTVVSDTTVTVTESVLWANPIRVAWQESDLSLFSPESAPLLALQSATAAISSTTQEPSSNSGDSGGGDGLSSGAAAGIGVGAGIAGMVIIGALWWFAKRYRALRRNRNTDEGGKT